MVVYAIKRGPHLFAALVFWKIIVLYKHITENLSRRRKPLTFFSLFAINSYILMDILVRTSNY